MATPSARFWWSAALAVAALAPLPAAARAHSVTLLGINGEGGVAIAAQIEQGLAELYDLVDGAIYKTAAEDLNRKTASPEDVADVAHHQRIDAVVAGSTLAGERLRIIVRDGGNGEVVARNVYPLHRAVLSPETRDAVIRDLVEALDRCAGVARPTRRPPVASRPVEDDDDVKSARAAKANPELDDEAPPLARKPARRPRPADEEEPPRRRDDEPPADDRRAATDEPPPEEPPAPVEPVVVRKKRTAPPGYGVEAGVGFGLLSRNLDIHAPGATPYRGSAVASLRFDATLFPFAWSRALRAAHPALATFGVAVSWIEALPFHSSSAIGAVTPGNARRWSLGIVSRIPFGSAKAPSLAIATGVGSIDYKSDDPTLLGVPDVSYRHVHFGLTLDVPFGTPRVSLAAAASVLALFDAGAIGTAAEYGAGSGWGADGALMLTVRPTRWLWLRAGVRYTSVSLTFGGFGAHPASGATDGYFDGAFEVGYSG